MFVRFFFLEFKWNWCFYITISIFSRIKIWIHLPFVITLINMNFWTKIFIYKIGQVYFYNAVKAIILIEILNPNRICLFSSKVHYHQSGILVEELKKEEIKLNRGNKFLENYWKGKAFIQPVFTEEYLVSGLYRRLEITGKQETVLFWGSHKSGDELKTNIYKHMITLLCNKWYKSMHQMLEEDIIMRSRGIIKNLEGMMPNLHF